MKKIIDQIKRRLMDTTLFWRLYFWWGIRQARKRRIAREAEIAQRPQMDTDEYWASVHAKKQEKD